MSMDINTNIDALNALRNLGTTSTAFSSSVSKLSSGLRINTAADDAAGLSIATKLGSQVTGLNQAQRNAQDGVSMVQTAEGALNQVQTMLQRIRELSVEAANSTLSTDDASSVNAEITALQQEITRTATSTKFNGQSLLTGALATSQDPTSTAKAGYSHITAGGTNNSTVAITGVSVSGATASTQYNLSNALGVVSLTDGTTTQNVTVTVGAAGTQTLNFDKLGVSLTINVTQGGGTGASAAEVATQLNGLMVKTAATNQNAIFQIGANQGDTLQVAFGNAQSSALAGIDAAITAFGNAVQGTGSVSGTAGALITATDAAISAVSTMNSQYGAVENRLNNTVATLSVTSQNLQASQSRIKDLNVAAEMVNFTKTQILQQAGTAILAQANSAPQNILTLLR